jgi:hypothetical protein
MEGRLLRKHILPICIAVLACISTLSGCLTQNNPSNTIPAVDTDKDGLSDEQESIIGTDPTNSDSDNDSVYDFFETDNGTAIDTDGDGIIDALDTDDDGDTILTRDEHPNDNGDGNPSNALDTDHDGIPDYLDNDDDNDGILTSTEEAYSAIFDDDVDNDSLLNYQDTDSDNDSKNDNVEGTGDSDGDGIPNFIDTNDDDGPLGDLDGDGVTNQQEGSTDPVPPDSDNDGTPDYLDPDSHDGSDSTPPEQARFLGSWHNEANENEHWIFYSNWTQIYTILVTDNPPGEPYTAELRFNYTLANSTFCQSVLIGGDAPPSCYPYEFSEQDMVLTLSNNGEVMVVLIRD